MPLHPRTCSLLYSISCLLDALDGYAARYYEQSTRFGAVLDMVTDRCTTSCLLVFLSSAFPRWAIIFQSLISLDFASHYIHMYTTLVMGGADQSHKSVDKDRSWILNLYYTNRVRNSVPTLGSGIASLTTTSLTRHFSSSAAPPTKSSLSLFIYSPSPRPRSRLRSSRLPSQTIFKRALRSTVRCLASSLPIRTARPHSSSRVPTRWTAFGRGSLPALASPSCSSSNLSMLSRLSRRADGWPRVISLCARPRVCLGRRARRTLELVELESATKRALFAKGWKGHLWRRPVSLQ